MQIIIDTETKNFQNSSLNRGLQTFTSLISDNEKIIFLDAHLDRLLRGADWLFPQEKWSLKRQEIKDFLQLQFKPSSYFRLMIFDDKLIFSQGEWNPRESGDRVTIAQTIKTPTLVPSFVKSSAYLVAEAELREARLKGFDDVIFKDVNHSICEASTANIFAVTRQREIITPHESSTVLSGVMRRKLIEFLQKNHYHVQVSDLGQEQLMSCAEIWMTNSVSGIRACSAIEGKPLANELWLQICQQFGRYGECYE